MLCSGQKINKNFKKKRKKQRKRFPGRRQERIGTEEVFALENIILLPQVLMVEREAENILWNHWLHERRVGLRVSASVSCGYGGAPRMEGWIRACWVSPGGLTPSHPSSPSPKREHQVNTELKLPSIKSKSYFHGPLVAPETERWGGPFDSKKLKSGKRFQVGSKEAVATKQERVAKKRGAGKRFHRPSGQQVTGHGKGAPCSLLPHLCSNALEASINLINVSSPSCNEWVVCPWYKDRGDVFLSGGSHKPERTGTALGSRTEIATGRGMGQWREKLQEFKNIQQRFI